MDAEEDEEWQAEADQEAQEAHPLQQQQEELEEEEEVKEMNREAWRMGGVEVGEAEVEESRGEGQRSTSSCPALPLPWALVPALLLCPVQLETIPSRLVVTSMDSLLLPCLS